MSTSHDLHKIFNDPPDEAKFWRILNIFIRLAIHTPSIAKEVQRLSEGKEANATFKNSGEY
jgi:hypothetical protein